MEEKREEQRHPNAMDRCFEIVFMGQLAGHENEVTQNEATHEQVQHDKDHPLVDDMHPPAHTPKDAIANRPAGAARAGYTPHSSASLSSTPRGGGEGEGQRAGEGKVSGAQDEQQAAAAEETRGDSSTTPSHDLMPSALSGSIDCDSQVRPAMMTHCVVSMEALPLHPRLAGGSAKEYLVQKEATLRLQFSQMEEAVEELVTALHDCRVLAAGVWQATVAERVASSVVPILSTLSTLLMSLTFQPGAYSFYAEAKHFRHLDSTTKTDCTTPTRRMPLAGKAAASYASYSAASYASYPSGVVARDVPQPSDVAPSNLHHASRNELDGNGDRLSKEVALEEVEKTIEEMEEVMSKGCALLATALRTLHTKTLQQEQQESQGISLPHDSVWTTYLSRKADYLAFRKLQSHCGHCRRVLREVREQHRELHPASEAKAPHGTGGKEQVEEVEETEADDTADDREPESTHRSLQARASPARKCLATHSSDRGGRVQEGEASSAEAKCLWRVPSAGWSDGSSDSITSSEQRLLLVPRERSGFQGPELCWSKQLGKELVPNSWDFADIHKAHAIFGSGLGHHERDLDTQRMLNHLQEYLEPMVFAPHSTLIRAHTMGTRMFFVQSGRCNVIVDGLVKATRSRGDFIGEIALVNASERMADVVAEDQCEVYSLSRARFMTVAAKFPQIYHRLKQTSTERVERQGWSNKMEADERALKAVKMRGSVHLGTQLHADWPVLVAFCDEILDAIGGLPAENGLSYPSLDLCEILEEVMANFTHTRYSGGQVMVHKGTTTMGIDLLSSGSAVIEKGGSRTELLPGAHMGLITLFFTGSALHEVRAGPSGAGVWSLKRLCLINLCQQFPFLQDALRGKALKQTGDIAKFPHLSTV